MGKSWKFFITKRWHQFIKNRICYPNSNKVRTDLTQIYEKAYPVIEIKDLDIWLHLATGRYIFETFSIPKIDILSCTIANQPWINHEWLFQMIIFLFHQWGGFEGLINLQAVGGRE